VALLLIVPGGGWHSGYFGELAAVLQKDSIFVASYDVVSMGYSDAEPGSPQGCIHVNEFDDLVEDVFEAVEWAQKEAGSTTLPVFLLGESFGGLQVLAAGLDAEIPLAGVIVLGAVIEIAPGLLPPRFVISMLSLLAPYYPKMKMPATDMSSTFDEAFGDPEWAAIARRDQAVQISPQPTLGAAVATVTTGEKVASRVQEWNLPLLAIHGIHDCRAMFAATQQFVDQAGAHAQGYWVQDTTGHQLLQDRPEITGKVISKIVDWITVQVSKN
jgi:alpha-beta hydrolase superfamily lysophospholipase